MKSFTLSLRSLVLVLVGVTACWGPPADAKPSGDFYEEVSRLSKVLSEINRKYVEEVDPAELTGAAINGIRNVLDPHTAVFSPKDYDDLKVSTEGEFGGIGITIAIRDNVLTIVSPLQGTPAFNMGLQAGDRIVRIEGKSTQGMTLDKAVEQLRGIVGTAVTITIVREGAPEPMDYTITRGRIVIHSVPFAGIIEGDIGYIKVANFSQKTASDMETAIRGLQKQGMKKLLLDLRFNPGGLLNQAIEVSELFLRKGNVVVSTRGRTQKTESAASRDGILGNEVPMVVLVNEGSASASEIVAGALQDWDRALVLGKTTFGKGSVQTIFPLDNQGHALKLTTAFYYLPMGRCINKPENSIRAGQANQSQPIEVEDEDTPAVDSAVRDTQTYFTAGGRKVFGGGGITPDIEVAPKPQPWLIQAQERQSMFFKFAVKYRSQLDKAGVQVDASWVVPDSVFRVFKEFCMQDTNFTKLKSNAQATLEIMENLILREQRLLTGDTTKIIANTDVSAAVSNLRNTLLADRRNQFELNRAYILDAIKRELIAVYQGEEGRISWTLRSDTQVQEAVRILKDGALYSKKLAPVTDATKAGNNAGKPAKGKSPRRN